MSDEILDAAAEKIPDLELPEQPPAPNGGPLPEGRDSIVKLEDIKLQVGDTLQLQSNGDQGNTRYYVKLIGYLPGKSVLVSTPVIDGKVCLMREGQTFVVRCFSGKNAYAFPTTIFKSLNTPFPHLHLSYPREVRGIVVRKGARVDVNVIAAIQVMSGTRAKAQAAGSLLNLSVGGALLSTKTALGAKGDRISIKFRINLQDIEAFPQLEAVIRSVSTDPMAENGAPNVLHGLEFKEIPQGDRVMLTAFVYQRLLEASALG